MTTSSEFKSGMRRLVSGVSLITTAYGGNKFGTIVTSVTSVSAEPPTLLMCLNHANSCHDAVMKSGVFCVNLLPRNAEDLSVRFATPKDRDQRFNTGHWMNVVTGAPVLEEATASFDCRVKSHFTANSHTIFVGEVEHVRLREEMAPLVYGNGSYGDFAPAFSS